MSPNRLSPKVSFLCVFMSAITRSWSALATSNGLALVTGSTDGIGLTTAKNLAAKGYDVIVHGRDRKRIQDACATVKAFADQSSSANSNRAPAIYSIQADISTVRGCESLVQEVESLLSSNNLNLDILVNNAGVFAQQKRVTEDGLEETFAVNVVAPFLITSHLLPQLVSSPLRSRVVIASSISQCYSIDDWDDLNFEKRRYSDHRSYSETKLMDAMLTMEFADRIHAMGIGTDKITCNCCDPGTVNTKMLIAGWGNIGIEVEQALHETWLCTSEEIKDTTGTYFIGRRARRASPPAYDKTERAKLWQILCSIAPKAGEKWNK